MEWLNDTYPIAAGDASAVFASRGYNMRQGRWETLPGVNLSPSETRHYRVRVVDIRVYHAGFTVASGVRIWIAVVGDGLHTECVLPLVDGVQSVSNTVHWHGNEPLLAGIVWRIPKGGVVAADFVGIGVGYER